MAIKNYKEFLAEHWDNPTPPDGPDYKEGKYVSGEYKCIANDGEQALLQKGDTLFLFYYEHIEDAEWHEYVDREETGYDEDEDGKSTTYSDDFEITDSAIESFINAKKDLEVGKGLDNMETGNFDIVEITPDVAMDYINRVKGLKDKYPTTYKAAISMITHLEQYLERHGN